MVAVQDNKRIAKNTIFMYCRTAITIAIGLYTSRIVLGALGVVDYGIYNVVGGIVVLFSFLTSALGQASQRFMSYEMGRGDEAKLRETFSTCLCVHILLSVVVLILGETIGTWLLFNKLVIPPERIATAAWLFQFSLLSSAISITQVPYNATIIAHEKFNIFAYISLFEAAVKLGIAFTLLHFSENRLLLYGSLILAQTVLVTLIYRLYCHIKFRETHFKISKNKEMFKNIFSYSSWSLIGNIADVLSDQGVNILLNIFFGPSVNAARGIAVNVKNALMRFVGSFQGVASPQIIKLYAAGNVKGMQNLVIMSSKFSFFLFLFFMLPLCMEMRAVIYLWLGRVPDHVVAFSILILVQILLMSMSGTLQSVIQATGKIKFYHIFVGALKLTSFPLCYLSLKMGAIPEVPFMIVLFVYSFIVYVNLFIVRKLVRFPIMIYIKKVVMKDLLVLLFSLVLPLSIRMNFEESFVRCLITIFASLFSVVLSVYFIGFSSDELQRFVNFVQKKVRKS